MGRLWNTTSCLTAAPLTHSLTGFRCARLTQSSEERTPASKIPHCLAVSGASGPYATSGVFTQRLHANATLTDPTRAHVQP